MLLLCQEGAGDGSCVCDVGVVSGVAAASSLSSLLMVSTMKMLMMRSMVSVGCLSLLIADCTCCYHCVLSMITITAAIIAVDCMALGMQS